MAGPVILRACCNTPAIHTAPECALRGAAKLATEIKTALLHGSNIAAPDLLARYARQHRLSTRTLFDAIAKLYGDDTMPARLLRAASLRIGNRIAPLKARRYQHADRNSIAKKAPALI